jgi:hypothetical protein
MSFHQSKENAREILTLEGVMFCGDPNKNLEIYNELKDKGIDAINKKLKEVNGGSTFKPNSCRRCRMVSERGNHGKGDR